MRAPDAALKDRKIQRLQFHVLLGGASKKENGTSLRSSRINTLTESIIDLNPDKSVDRFAKIALKAAAESTSREQGALLCFNIMTGDLEIAIKSIPGVPCSLYADEVVLWATSSNIKSLEKAINVAMEAAPLIHILYHRIHLEKEKAQLPIGIGRPSSPKLAKQAYLSKRDIRYDQVDHWCISGDRSGQKQ
ncbi:hypothetical protein ILUMI_03311, partial [Ignelater luminosus]